MINVIHWLCGYLLIGLSISVVLVLLMGEKWIGNYRQEHLPKYKLKTVFWMILIGQTFTWPIVLLNMVISIVK